MPRCSGTMFSSKLRVTAFHVAAVVPRLSRRCLLPACFIDSKKSVRGETCVDPSSSSDCHSTPPSVHSLTPVRLVVGASDSRAVASAAAKGSSSESEDVSGDSSPLMSSPELEHLDAGVRTTSPRGSIDIDAGDEAVVMKLPRPRADDMNDAPLWRRVTVSTSTASLLVLPSLEAPVTSSVGSVLSS